MRGGAVCHSNSMPKNAKDMKLNPNRDSHSSFSEDVHSKKTKKQTDNGKNTDG